MGRVITPGRVATSGSTGRVETVGRIGTVGGISGVFSPLSVATLKLWLRADLGNTLGGILKPTGTAPPAATITGTATTVVGPHFEVDSVAGGTGLGQATFKWSMDNGSTYVATGVATAASVVLGTTGLTMQFPVGPYNIDNKWDATISARADQSGNSNDLSQVTPGLQPLCFVSAVNGRPVVRWDGVDDFLQASFALVEPCTLVIAIKTINADTNARCPWDGGPAAIQSMWSVFRTSGVSGILDSNGTLLVCPNKTNLVYRVYAAIYNHASSSVHIDRSATNGTIGAASAAITGFTIGALANGGLPLSFDDAEIALYSSELSAADLLSLELYMQTEYATS